MEQKHFSHNHGLVFHQMPQGSEIHCSGCKSPGSGNVYVCWQCGYFLHEQCFHAKRSLKHPSHPLHPLTLVPYPIYPSASFFCNTCHLGGNGFSYCCSECEFDLHVHCALLPNNSNNNNNNNNNPNIPYPNPSPFPLPHNEIHNSNQNSIYPPPHPQSSTYPPVPNNPFPTYPPLQNHDSQNPTYPPMSNSPFPTYPPPQNHDSQNLTPQPQNPTYPPMPNSPFPNYTNPSQPTPPPNPNNPPPAYPPASAPHGYPQQTPPPQPQTNPTIMTDSTVVSTMTTTPPAGNPPTTTSQPKPSPIIKHFSHPHVLKAMEIDKNSGKVCSACEYAVSGSAYCCTEAQCKFNLHKTCFDSPLELKHKSHLQHPLKLLTAPPYADGFTCNACLKDGKAFAYTCSACQYDLHIDCVSWPETVTRSDHNHPMKLFYSSPAVETSQDVTFMCDVCKNPVHEMAWIYYCRECDFGTHLECITAAVKEDGSSAGWGAKTEEALLTETEIKLAMLQLLHGSKYI